MPAHASKRRRRGYRLKTPAEFVSPLKPAWIRIDQTKYYFGLTRSATYEILNSGKVANKHIKLSPKSKRSIRLIDFASLSKYINDLPDAESPKSPTLKAA